MISICVPVQLVVKACPRISFPGRIRREVLAVASVGCATGRPELLKGLRTTGLRAFGARARLGTFRAGWVGRCASRAMRRTTRPRFVGTVVGARSCFPARCVVDPSRVGSERGYVRSASPGKATPVVCACTDSSPRTMLTCWPGRAGGARSAAGLRTSRASGCTSIMSMEIRTFEPPYADCSAESAILSACPCSTKIRPFCAVQRTTWNAGRL